MFYFSVENGYTQNTAESSLFQCQRTTGQSGHVFTPNIPDSYFNHVNALALTQQGTLIPVSVQEMTIFVFTIPPEAICSGTVLAIEFCYLAFDGEIGRNNRNVFRFTSLSRDGFQFTVIDFGAIRIRANPQTAICSILLEDGSNSEFICCDIYTLPNDEQFQIPSSDFTSFGVETMRDYQDEFRLLNFSHINTEFRSQHFQGMPADNDNPNRVGDTFTFKRGDLQSEGSLLLLRLIIGTYLELLMHESYPS